MNFRVQTLGHSLRDNPIHGHVAGRGLEGGLLLLGGTHGDERASVDLLERWLVDSSQHADWSFPVYVIPCLNPDGFAANTRYNGRGVDLNRNFPAAWSADSVEPSGDHALSEPESRVLHSALMNWRPDALVSLHWALAEIDGDGEQSRPLVEAMWAALPESDRRSYRRSFSVPQSGDVNPPPGSPHTWDGPPGSLGRWAGHELRYPTGRKPAMITLELPYDITPSPRPETLPEAHLQWVKDHYAIRRDAYLNYTYQSLCPMLQAAFRFVSQVRS
jgi:Zinc carboxypeptidase